MDGIKVHILFVVWRYLWSHYIWIWVPQLDKGVFIKLCFKNQRYDDLCGPLRVWFCLILLFRHHGGFVLVKSVDIE